ncbi:monovalent cation/H(+) antiporter subunit G [Candidatus Entotheonella palauensis]|uniref:monovalent cation/H(+) antiporter subunit G n=1 Tax=Candidatus Entotheonella palauensis TaxID=93172 RepID=UPI00277B5C90|nr:monovalent cation/H(+) antiporter subunit G [Candidatus Entotheonella palauensis]
MLANVLLILGLFFILAGVLGVLRFPDFYTRLHAMGKCDTLGVTLVLLALAIYAEFSLVTVKVLLLSVFIGLANPVATHALGRAAMKSGLEPWFNQEPKGEGRG